MKRLLLVLTLATTALSIQSCKKIKGDGPVITEYRTARNFRGIYTGIDGDVHYRNGNSYSVEIHGQQNILDLIDTRVSGNELRIQYNGTHNIGKHDRIDVYITSPEMTSLSVSGSGGLDVIDGLDAGNVDLRVTGSGSLDIDKITASSVNARISGSGDIYVNNGTTTDEELEISGSGQIDMLNVVANKARTRTYGSGNTKVQATRELEVTITGSGNVIYKGNPAINTNITGSGRVQRW